MKIEKNNVFWYLIIPVLIGITLIISLSPWAFELLATPADRIFTGINRWSTDYYIYLSYVELGIRGQLGAKLLITTAQQQPVFAHLVYTLPGFIFGKLGLSSIFIYHFCRSLYGLFFLITTIYLFYRLSKSKIITFVSFFLSFYVSGFVRITGLSPLTISRYLDWFQEQNSIGRASGTLHHSVGFIFFILGFLYYFRSKNRLLKKIIIFGLLANLTLLANPFAFLIFGISFFLYMLVIIIIKVIKIITVIFRPEDFFVLFFGFLSTLPLLLYYRVVLSNNLWGITGNSPNYFYIDHPPIHIGETLLSVGPVFFLSFIGIIFIIVKRKKTAILTNELIFLIIWPAVQFFLFFCGDTFKIHPLRAFSGLYYLPLSLFSAYCILYLVQAVSKKLSTRLYSLFVVLTVLFLITLPNYYLCYKELLFAFTDFKSFSVFSYPTKKQAEAFAFLEKNTPPASGVLAMYEASSLIMGLSGNAGELGMDHGIKTRFYQNAMTENQALQFLKHNRFRYVYVGYQEKSAGGNMDKLPYLKKIFDNNEVTIYIVLQSV